jgi:Predicted transcriptional regulator
MKINLMTDYAVRVICSIYKSDKGTITSNYMSKTEEISHGVLMKVLRELRENEIVASHQGRGEIAGGYTLKKSIKEITVLDIIEIMEGTIILEKIGKNGSKRIEDIENNEVLKEYRRVSQVLREELKRNTLYDILNGMKHKE